MVLTEVLSKVRMSGLPLTEWVVLAAVVENTGMTQPKLAASYFPGLSRQFASTVVKRLKEVGLVVSVPDPSHGRRVIILPTKEGVALVELVSGK